MPRAAHGNLGTLSQGQKGMICSSRGGCGAENLLQKGAGRIPPFAQPSLTPQQKAPRTMGAVSYSIYKVPSLPT